MSFTSSDNAPIDRIGVKGPLVFDKTSFNLNWTDNPNETYYIQEYLPKGEKTERFNQMITIHLFNKDIPLKNAVQQKAAELATRKTTDPICNYQVNQSPDGNEYMVDFILGENQGNKSAITEFNIYRYKQADLGPGKKGILVYAYTRRAYGDESTAFLKNLKTERPALLKTMAGTKIPAVKISGK